MSNAIFEAISHTKCALMLFREALERNYECAKITFCPMYADFAGFCRSDPVSGRPGKVKSRQGSRLNISFKGIVLQALGEVGRTLTHRQRTDGVPTPFRLTTAK